MQASGLTDQWWTVPVLILSAAQNALLEEVVVIGYLFTRLRQLAWNAAAIVALSAIIRGSYHLYQGIGGFIGNLIMGVDLRPDLPALEARRPARSLPTPCWISRPSWDTPLSLPASTGFELQRWTNRTSVLSDQAASEEPQV